MRTGSTGRRAPGRRPVPALLAGGLASGLVAAAALSGPTALAEPPLSDVTDAVEDRADAFTPEQEQSLSDRAEGLEEATGSGFHVVTVSGFDGVEQGEWADETAVSSGVGDDDILLALAPQSEQFGISVSTELMNDSQYESLIRDHLEPSFGTGELIAVPMRAMDGAQEILTAGGAGGVGASGGIGGAGGVGGSAESEDEDEEEGELGDAGLADLLPGVGWLVPLAGGALLLFGLIGYLRKGNRRARRHRRTPSGPAQPQVPLEQLRQETDRFLLGADDALAASEQEIEFAEAEFGPESTRAARQALGTARDELTTAFSEVSALSPDHPEQRRRAVLTEANDRVGEAMTALQGEANAIASLRNDVRNAPARIRRLREQLGALRPRIRALPEAVSSVASRWSDTAARAVADHPDQAHDAEAAARTQLDTAESLSGEVTAGGDLIAALRSAESETARATTLTEAVENLSDRTAGAAAELPELVTAVESLLVQARATRSDDPRFAQFVALAEQTLTTAARDRERDPLGASSRLDDARAKLDDVLARSRSDYDAARAATQDLARTTALAEAEIDTAESLLTTHRAVIGTSARSALSQSESLLDRAETLADPDPVAAADLARRALETARTATSQARSDIEAGRRPDGYAPANVGADILGEVFRTMNRSHYRRGGYFPMGRPPIMIGGFGGGSGDWPDGNWSGSGGRDRGAGWSGGFSSGSHRRSSGGGFGGLGGGGFGGFGGGGFGGWSGGGGRGR